MKGCASARESLRYSSGCSRVVFRVRLVRLRRPLALRKLNTAGLLSRFDVVSTCEMKRAQAKPAPDLIRLAAHTLYRSGALFVMRIHRLEYVPALAAECDTSSGAEFAMPDALVSALGTVICSFIDRGQSLLEACFDV